MGGLVGERARGGKKVDRQTSLRGESTGQFLDMTGVQSLTGERKKKTPH